MAYALKPVSFTSESLAYQLVQLADQEKSFVVDKNGIGIEFSQREWKDVSEILKTSASDIFTKCIDLMMAVHADHLHRLGHIGVVEHESIDIVVLSYDHTRKVTFIPQSPMEIQAVADKKIKSIEFFNETQSVKLRIKQRLIFSDIDCKSLKRPLMYRVGQPLSSALNQLIFGHLLKRKSGNIYFSGASGQEILFTTEPKTPGIILSSKDAFSLSFEVTEETTNFSQPIQFFAKLFTSSKTSIHVGPNNWIAISNLLPNWICQITSLKSKDDLQTIAFFETLLNQMIQFYEPQSALIFQYDKKNAITFNYKMKGNSLLLNCGADFFIKSAPRKVEALSEIVIPPKFVDPLKADKVIKTVDFFKKKQKIEVAKGQRLIVSDIYKKHLVNPLIYRAHEPSVEVSRFINTYLMKKTRLNTKFEIGAKKDILFYTEPKTPGVILVSEEAFFFSSMDLKKEPEMKEEAPKIEQPRRLSSISQSGKVEPLIFNPGNIRAYLCPGMPKKEKIRFEPGEIFFSDLPQGFAYEFCAENTLEKFAKVLNDLCCQNDIPVLILKVDSFDVSELEAVKPSKINLPERAVEIKICHPIELYLVPI